MKKLIYLFLLLPFISIGQVANGTETKANAFRALSPQTISTPTYLGTLGVDGTMGKAPSALFAKTTDLEKLIPLPTGFISGLAISINADPTKINIASGYYTITDFTNPLIPVVTIKTYAGATGVTPTYLASANASYIALDIDGNIVQSSSPFTNENRRTLAIVGSAVHSNNTTVNVTNEIKAPILAIGNQLHDFMKAIGFLNEEGNVYSSNGANLMINKTAGKISGLGINASNYLNPNQLTIASQTAVTFAYRLRDGTQYANTQNIDPNNYDNAGALTAVAVGNKWTIPRINLFQSGLARIQYGQTVYNSYANALAALRTESFVTEQNIAENSIFRSYLIVKQGTTDLSAAILAGTASFHPVDKFGNVVGNSSLALTYANIVAALGFTPEDVGNKATSFTTVNNTLYPSVQAVSEGTVFKRTIAQIRSLSGVLPNNNFYTTDVGMEGNWRYDSSDVASADNTGTILVTSDGKRIKRVIQGNTNVKWFGAKGDGTTNDTSAIQLALDNIPTQGASLFFPYGIYLVPSGGLVVSKQTLFIGEGRNEYEFTPTYAPNRKGSVISTSSPTANLITSNAEGTSFSNIAFENTSGAATAGNGILLNEAGSFHINNISIKGFYNNLQIFDATRWSVSSSNFIFPVNYGIYIHNDPLVPGFTDTGDTSISGVNIICNNNTATGIRFESSGGLKINNTKINTVDSSRIKIAVDIFATGAGTSILLISNSSFEGFTDYGVKVRKDVGTEFSTVIIDGNQFFPVVSNITGNCISFLNMYLLVVSDNIFNNASFTNPNAAVSFNACDKISYSGNIFWGTWGSESEFINCTNVVKPLLEESNQMHTGSISFKSPSGFFSANFSGQGGADIVALGNISNKPSIQGYSSDFLAIKPLVFQGQGGNVLVATSTDDGINELQVGGSAKIASLSGSGDAYLKTNPTGEISRGSALPLVYVVKMSQSGTSAPTIVSTGDNTIGAIVWTRGATGNFSGTLTGAFPSGKVYAFIGSNSNTTSGQQIVATRSTDNAFSILTYLSGVATDGVLNNFDLEIRVYP
jgi:hypothetical protein